MFGVARDLPARFQGEAWAAGQLDHPGVVRVHQCGDHEGQPFLVMEYLPGGSLSARLKGEPLGVRESAELVGDVARAVQEVKAGKVEFRVDKTGVIHVPFGKTSFDANKLVENANTLLNAVIKAKPSAAKGKYVRSVTVCSTMGPGVKLDVATLQA